MKDLTGKKFGRLKVIRRGENDSNKRCQWVCLCECGNEILVKSRSLTSGDRRSCGCLQTEVNSKVHTKHGNRNTRIYRIWQSMKTRCNNPNSDAYTYYGKRGIFVCNEWNSDFQSFYEWAMKNGYRYDLTIDRIDVDKGYFPENCRWATRKEQTRNRRNTIKIPLGEIAEIEGIDYQEAYKKYVLKK